MQNTDIIINMSTVKHQSQQIDASYNNSMAAARKFCYTQTVYIVVVLDI